MIPSVFYKQFVGEICDPNQMELETPVFYAGDKMLMRRDYMKVDPAISNNSYKWQLVESLVNESIVNELKLDPKEHPFLLSEPSMHDKDMRIKCFLKNSKCLLCLLLKTLCCPRNR